MVEISNAGPEGKKQPSGGFFYLIMGLLLVSVLVMIGLWTKLLDFSELFSSLQEYMERIANDWPMGGCLALGVLHMAAVLSLLPLQTAVGTLIFLVFRDAQIFAAAFIIFLINLEGLMIYWLVNSKLLSRTRNSARESFAFEALKDIADVAEFRTSVEVRLIILPQGVKDAMLSILGISLRSFVMSSNLVSPLFVLKSWLAASEINSLAQVFDAPKPLADYGKWDLIWAITLFLMMLATLFISVYFAFHTKKKIDLRVSQITEKKSEQSRNSKPEEPLPNSKNIDIDLGTLNIPIVESETKL